MIRIRKASDRGHAHEGWLKTYHTFSFSSYQDPEHMRFRNLRVMNEDWIAPSQGFGMHPHRDMEIVTYVLEGTLQHEDSMGNGELLRPGEFQHMSAGTGILHSEWNPSPTEPVHLYQIWLFPARKGITPSYDQKYFENSEKQNQLCLVASTDGRNGSLKIETDAAIFLATLQRDRVIEKPLEALRFAWLQVLRGSLTINEQPLLVGDGAAIGEEKQLTIRASEDAEFLLFDLA